MMNKFTDEDRDALQYETDKMRYQELASQYLNLNAFCFRDLNDFSLAINDLNVLIMGIEKKEKFSQLSFHYEENMKDICFLFENYDLYLPLNQQNAAGIQNYHEIIVGCLKECRAHLDSLSQNEKNLLIKDCLEELEKKSKLAASKMKTLEPVSQKPLATPMFMKLRENAIKLSYKLESPFTFMNNIQYKSYASSLTVGQLLHQNKATINHFYEKLGLSCELLKNFCANEGAVLNYLLKNPVAVETYVLKGTGTLDDFNNKAIEEIENLLSPCSNFYPR